MKKITIYVLSLNYGGAERAITNIANILSQDNEITIKSIYKLNNKPFFTLNPNIKVIYLTNLSPNRKEFKQELKNLNIIKMLKEGFKSINILYNKRKSIINSIKNDNSDIIITTRKEHNYYLSKYAKKNIIKIGQEHNDFTSKKDIKKVIKGAKRLDYFMPSSLFLTNQYKKLLENYQVIVKYIPLSIDEYKTKEVKKENQIIAVGRIEKIKALDDLIDIFEIVHKKINNLKLIVVGTGSELESLQIKVSSKKLKEYVIFKGAMHEEELKQEYEKSKLLVCTSLQESFGLVAIEAANTKTPTIAFDSAKGLKEILANSGILISNRNKEEMASKIIEIIKNDEWKELGEIAKNNISQYYTQNVSKTWLNFINKDLT